jgi:uncharacterized membrane protein YfcA
MDLLELVVIGLAVGLAGGLFGIGGGVVLIPALTILYGPNQHLYQSAALIVNFFVAVPAVYQHLRARAIHGRLVGWLVPVVIVSVLAGVLMSEAPIFSGAGEAWLRLVFAGFLVFAAMVEVLHIIRPIPAESWAVGTQPAVALSGPRMFSVAVPTGLIAGLLGVGGGVLAVPLQRRLLHVPLRNAIANSAAMIIATSLFGACTKNYAYYQGHAGSLEAVALALMVAPAAVTGSLVGARLTHRLRLMTLRVLFIALLLLAAGRMGTGAVADLRSDVALARSAVRPEWDATASNAEWRTRNAEMTALEPAIIRACSSTTRSATATG